MANSLVYGPLAAKTCDVHCAITPVVSATPAPCWNTILGSYRLNACPLEEEEEACREANA